MTEELLTQACGDKDVEFVLIDNGDEALRIFNESKPGEFAAIFMDIVMPKKTGIMILHEIRSMERSDAKSVPIIIVSALSEDNEIIGPEERVLITDYIQKPLSVEKFQKTLQKIKLL